MPADQITKSTSKKGLRYKLLIIEVLIFLLPCLVIAYIFYKNNVFLRLSQMTIIAFTLLMILTGMIILRQIFENFLKMARIIKNAEVSDADISGAKKDICDLHEITVDFNRLMENFKKTTSELKQRVFEVFSLKELIELAGKSLDINKLLTVLLEKAMAVTSAQIGSVLLFESERGRFRVVALKGLNQGPEKDSFINVNRSILRYVVSEKKPLLVYDIESDPRTSKLNDPKYGPPSFLSMPILVKENLTAVLNISNKETKQVFDSNDEQILSIMISEVGFALENAQLHLRLEDHLKELNACTTELAIANEQLQKEVIERNHVEEVLRESEERYKLLAEYSADLIYKLNIENEQYTYASPSIQRILGYNHTEIPSLRVLDTLTLDSYVKQKEIMRKTMLSGNMAPEIMELEAVHKNGHTLPIEIHANFILDEQGNPIEILGVARDISERKQAEDEKKKLEIKLQEAKKMEAIATLAGGIAHQFNNALSVIMANLDLLELDLENGAIANDINAIKTSTYRMAQLTDQLLAYARGGKYLAKTVSLSDFVRETLPIIQHTIKPDVYLETDLPQNISSVNADVTQLQMVLSAILSNASESIEGKGRVRITCRNEHITDENVNESPELKPGSYVSLIIEDDGKGMDEETSKRIFEPFFTTKFHGRGLGMAAAYGIIKNHQGWISIESELGKGTKVCIYLTAVEDPAKEIVKIDTAPSEGTGTVLVIEDEEMLIQLTSEILERLGYRVLRATTGKEAVNIANDFEGDIDLAILDILLPDMDGTTIYPLLMKARPNMKVIVCSGYTIESPAQEILDAGAQGFIQKPFNMKDLSQKLKEVLCMD